jgi:integral membrane sensor domain MASE1
LHGISGSGGGVGAAYYTGAAVGLALKLPNATPSVLWPPNAILTAALLLTPYRVWPIALASALPAHVLLESGAGWPTTLVLALFATNGTEALIAASGIRWLSDAPARFDSLRRVGVFVGVAVAAAPLISSFPDAAAVSRVLGEPYWQVFTARLFSN